MMRFNEKELTSLALSTSVRFDKEGCLYMYDREGKYLKRTEAELWLSKTTVDSLAIVSIMAFPA
ncbi:hypothetical protein TrispH2_010527 [Trichoplax sp. H2]|nr:hypothetical protein TrispH2_010527 [Trichoplax sp. H2]|eukprot:RDD37551.1 hypothetical protein TrispH2_010527 [Trichoplax sp. H2]